MHAEWGRIDAVTADRLNAARADGRADHRGGHHRPPPARKRSGEDGVIRPFEGDTDIFITPVIDGARSTG
jgi:S-adenosylmethionine:tRNA ribosyltransferase-isomerase